MAINCVYLSADVFLVCLNHALSTEKEEVMGLLIGEVDEKQTSHVSAVIMLRRSDKRQDRVEISPEQLSAASTKAETRKLGRPMRVLGWYHSHPHITVWPSHVDVQTQAMYQMMDEGFVGLIFSVFNEDKVSKQGSIQLTCFQSTAPNVGSPSQIARVDVPVHIVPTSHISQICLETLIELPAVLCQEEQDAYNNTIQASELDILSKLHNSAVYTKSLCHITEVASVPLLQTLENRLQNNQEKIEELKKEKEKLHRRLKCL